MPQEDGGVLWRIIGSILVIIKGENNMKSFNVYHHANLNKYVAVKNGYSWSAFIFSFFGVFGCLWMLWNRLFLHSGLFLLTMIFVGLLNGAILASTGVDLSGIFYLITIGLAAAIGADANRWKRNNVIKRGYTLVLENVYAHNKEHAISSVNK